MENKSLSQRVVFALVLFLIVSFWLLVAWEVYRRHGVNHVGYDVRMLAPFFAAGVLFFSVFRRVATRSWLLLLLCLFSAVGVLLLHYANVLVDYDSWIERGMPSSFSGLL